MGFDTGSGILIIGVGNAYRRDDAAGLIVARRLKELGLESGRVLEHTGEGAALMESWKDAQTVILIDAVYSDAPPGTIHRFDARHQSLPAQIFRCSSHAFSIAEAVELARALNQLPQHVAVFGIEGKDFKAGTGLSPEVEKAVPSVVEQVLLHIRATKTTARS